MARSQRNSSMQRTVSRRDLLRFSLAGAAGGSVSGWFDAFAEEAARRADRRRSCILLWMSGGPSQMDTFDLKPGTANGGSFKEIATSAEGLRFSEHLPGLARQAHNLAIIRSMSTKEGDHGRATSFAHCGYFPQAAIRYPTLGSLVSKELGDSAAELPEFVSIAPSRAISPLAYDPGFLGAKYAPLLVGDSATVGEGEAPPLQVDDIRPPSRVAGPTVDDRLQLLSSLNSRFAARFEGGALSSYRAAYERGVRLMQSEAAGAFSLDEEPAKVRDAYGRNRFGEGCLMARRLIERGVPFVEVALGGIGQQILGWDTHANNFEQVTALSQVLDAGWASLLSELEERGRLNDTLIVWMGDFGRTPKINTSGGRDHYPQAWSTVLAGGGIRGGRVVGKTSADGTTVEERPVNIPDLLATVCRGLRIDPGAQNLSNVGRPIRIVDPAGKPIEELLA